MPNSNRSLQPQLATCCPEHHSWAAHSHFNQYFFLPSFSSIFAFFLYSLPLHWRPASQDREHDVLLTQLLPSPPSPTLIFIFPTVTQKHLQSFPGSSPTFLFKGKQQGANLLPALTEPPHYSVPPGCAWGELTTLCCWAPQGKALAEPHIPFWRAKLCCLRPYQCHPVPFHITQFSPGSLCSTLSNPSHHSSVKLHISYCCPQVFFKLCFPAEGFILSSTHFVHYIYSYFRIIHGTGCFFVFFPHCVIFPPHTLQQSLKGEEVEKKRWKWVFLDL